MAVKRISTLPVTENLPAGSVIPVVMGDGTGTKQISKENLQKEIGGSIATNEKVGTVKPDGKTVTIDEDGTIHCEGAGGNSGIKLANPSNVSITNFDEAAKIKWTDPDDVVYQGAKLATWQGTVVVRKEGGTPQDWTDGVLVERVTEKNKYKDTPLIDGNLTNGTEYCYGIFPYSDQTVYNYDFTRSFVPEEIRPATPTLFNPRGTDGTVTIDVESKTADALVKIVYKAGSAPSSSTDGTVIDGLSTGTVTVDGLTNGTKYYFVAYAYTNIRTSSASAVQSAIPKAYTLLGFRMKKSEGNPPTKVEYTEGSIGLAPAKVNRTTGVFDYGGFGGFWFVTENKAVMLRNNRTEAYELNPNDYTKKLDGSASDVSNAAFAGNAMSRIPKVYLKQWEANGYEYCNISDTKLDDTYLADAHTRADGTEMDYVYISMFEGSLVNNVLRSLKGQAVMTGKTGTEELTYAKANGTGHSTRSWSQHNLIDMLLILMAKTTDMQTAYGDGNYTGGTSAASLLTTGGASDKGQFFGTAGNGYVKVFHIENYWGNAWDRIEGCVTNAIMQILIKTKPPYNTDGNGYVNTGITPGGTSGGFISACKMTAQGLIPTTASGSETMQYPDGLWFAASCYAFVGGSCGYGLRVGAFALSLNGAVSDTGWYIGAALSCEQPLAA